MEKLVLISQNKYDNLTSRIAKNPTNETGRVGSGKIEPNSRLPPGIPSQYKQYQSSPTAKETKEEESEEESEESEEEAEEEEEEEEAAEGESDSTPPEVKAAQREQGSVWKRAWRQI